MPFAPHYRLTALGRLGNVEKFAYSLALSHTTTDALPFINANDTVYADMAADIRAFHARPTSQIHPAAVLEEVKIASIGADGKYVSDPIVINVADAPGGSTAPAEFKATTLPQSAMAVSLVTARRGPTGKGRFYIPMPVMPVFDTSFTIPDGNQTDLRASAQTLIQNLNNQPGNDSLGIQVVVASSKGYNTPVTGVRMGRVVDTIRSRRASVLEQYGAVLPVS